MLVDFQKKKKKKKSVISGKTQNLKLVSDQTNAGVCAMLDNYLDMYHVTGCYLSFFVIIEAAQTTDSQQAIYF